MDKLEDLLKHLNNELKLAEIEEEDLEKSVNEIRLFIEKNDDFIKKEFTSILEDNINYEFDNEESFFINYNFLVGLDEEKKTEYYYNYCNFINHNVKNSNLMGDEYLIKLDIHNRLNRIDETTIIVLLYLLSSINSYDFALKPILRIRKNKHHIKFTIFYFINNDLMEAIYIEDDKKSTSGATVYSFESIAHFKYIILNGKEYKIEGVSISSKENSFNLLTS